MMEERELLKLAQTQNVSVVPRKKRQCLWFECKYYASQGSKYCSYECGKKVMAARLESTAHYLVEEASKFTSQKKEIIGKMDLLEKKMRGLFDNVNTASGYARALRKYIESQLNIPFEPKEAVIPKKGAKEYVLCICCGVDIDRNSYGIHFVRCIAKKERSSCYGSDEKGNLILNILCETYTPRFKSYCKRFKIICPEHPCKDIDDNLKVCSYPAKFETAINCSTSFFLTSPDDVITTRHGYCKEKYNECNEHPNWYRNALAMVDWYRQTQMEKVVEARIHYNKHKVFLKTRGNVYNCISSGGVLQKFKTDCINGSIKLLDLVNVKDDRGDPDLVKKFGNSRIMNGAEDISSSSDDD
uniref:CXXC-type zinc finger protein 1 n=1 Tax=Rhabditophanes sp. KR3021 TaxID=114890 RepID=A0AC35TN24_9BILA